MEAYVQPGEEGPYAYSPYFDLEDGEPAIQALGGVLVREGRLITYPNAFQNRMLSVRLADSSKPGHRKYILLYLVDPNIKIVSTANVPPQQKAWWKGTLVGGSSRFGTLPAETFEQIISSVEDFPISMEDAKEIKEEMEEERKAL